MFYALQVNNATTQRDRSVQGQGTSRCDVARPARLVHAVKKNNNNNTLGTVAHSLIFFKLLLSA